MDNGVCGGVVESGYGGNVECACIFSFYYIDGKYNRRGVKPSFRNNPHRPITFGGD